MTERPHRSLRVVVAVGLVIAVTLGVGYLLLVPQVERNTAHTDRNTLAIARLVDEAIQHERDDAARLRSANFRICTRNQESRAALILHVAASTNTDEPRRVGELLRFLPLFDCGPNLVGAPARRLNERDARAYLVRFDHHAALALE